MAAQAGLEHEGREAVCAIWDLYRLQCLGTAWEAANPFLPPTAHINNPTELAALAGGFLLRAVGVEWG